MGQPRHKDDTKTFEELSYPEQAKSISSQLINLGRAIRHHAMDREEATAETRRKCLEQVDRFRTRLARRLGFLVSVLVVLLVSASVSAAPLKKLAGVNRAAKALIAAMPDLDAKTLESKLQDFRTEILLAEDEVKTRQEKEALAKFKEADDPFTMGILKLKAVEQVFARAPTRPDALAVKLECLAVLLPGQEKLKAGTKLYLNEPENKTAPPTVPTKK